jgi:hypothetical protein
MAFRVDLALAVATAVALLFVTTEAAPSKCIDGIGVGSDMSAAMSYPTLEESYCVSWCWDCAVGSNSQDTNCAGSKTKKISFYAKIPKTGISTYEQTYASMNFKKCETDDCNSGDACSGAVAASGTAATATTTTGALKCYVTDSSTTSGEKTYDCDAAIASTKNACYTLSMKGGSVKGCSATSEGCPALMKAYEGWGATGCTECNTNLCNTGNTGGAAGLYAGAWTSVLASVVLLVNVHF